MELKDTNTGINLEAAAAMATAQEQAERQLRSAKIKAGAIGTAKAVGYMAVGSALTIGALKLKERRNAAA